MATIISDIDGTVLEYGRVMQPVVNYIKKNSTDVIFLTNRPESDRRRTVADLKKVGIKYSRLIMNDMNMSAPKFKKLIVEGLLEDKENPIDISEFIDDRIDNRNAIRSVGGIKVSDPSDIMKRKKEQSKASFSRQEIISLAYTAATDALGDFFDTFAAETSQKDDILVPQFIKDNAARGLELNRKGHGGDGLTDKTKNEARDMAKGKVTLGKCVRMSAWFARHKPDTTTDGFKNQKSKDYPSAGLVAWLLWGGDANGSSRAASWADKQVERFSKEK
jgi:hypothetical protein